MKIVSVDGILLELDENDMQKVREIADDLKCTVEEAVSKAIQNFLSRGVQTPDLKLAV